MALSGETYTIQSGDTLSSIATKLGVEGGWQALFAANAAGIQGSGWSILAWDTLGKRPILAQLYDQQANVPLGQVPIVLLDMWEHAFYLQYKNVKPDYIKAWWNVVNWNDVEARLANAKATNLVNL